MNLLEHYIKEIHNVTNITDHIAKHSGFAPSEPLLQVDLTYDCYGIIERKTMTFTESNWKNIKKTGYFMA